MAKLKINHYVVGPVQTNCYFAINDETKELIIIDPGYSPKQLAERVRQEGCTPVAILLTHGHFDHATGAADLAKEFSIPVYAYETEKETLENEEMNLCHMTGEHHVFHADIYLKDEQELDLAGFHIRVLHTPGHSPGHMCFWEPERGYLFTGDLVYKDVLFAYYPSTDPEAYLDSLEKVAALPVKQVFPAHHSLEIEPEILGRMRDVFRELKAAGKLRHGSGKFDYGDWGVWL